MEIHRPRTRRRRWIFCSRASGKQTGSNAQLRAWLLQSKRVLCGLRQLLLVKAGPQRRKVFITTVISGLGCSENPGISGRWILWRAETIHLQEAELDARTGVALLRSFFEPASGLFITLPDALSTKVKVGEVVLAEGVAVFGGCAIPPGSGGIILRHVETAVIEIAKLRLCA